MTAVFSKICKMPTILLLVGCKKAASQSKVKLQSFYRASIFVQVHTGSFGFLQNSGPYPRLACLRRKIRVVRLNFCAYKNENEPIGCICIVSPENQSQLILTQASRSSSLPRSCAKEKSSVRKHSAAILVETRAREICKVTTLILHGTRKEVNGRENSDQKHELFLIQDDYIRCYYDQGIEKEFRTDSKEDEL